MHSWVAPFAGVWIVIGLGRARSFEAPFVPLGKQGKGAVSLRRIIAAWDLDSAGLLSVERAADLED
jgi:hypothetical protein